MTGEQATYQLPLEVIVETMQGLREQVALRACVPALPGLLKQEAVAQIVVDESGLQRCVITNPASGLTLFAQGEAFNVLRRCGTLGWTLLRQASELASVPADVVPARAHAGLPSGSPIPRRQVELTPGQLLALSPAQKNVYALVNGSYPLERIAQVLAKAPQEISRILLELKQRSLIDL